MFEQKSEGKRCCQEHNLARLADAFFLFFSLFLLLLFFFSIIISIIIITRRFCCGVIDYYIIVFICFIYYYYYILLLIYISYLKLILNVFVAMNVMVFMIKVVHRSKRGGKKYTL